MREPFPAAKRRIENLPGKKQKGYLDWVVEQCIHEVQLEEDCTRLPFDIQREFILSDLSVAGRTVELELRASPEAQDEEPGRYEVICQNCFRATTASVYGNKGSDERAEYYCSDKCDEEAKEWRMRREEKKCLAKAKQMHRELRELLRLSPEEMERCAASLLRREESETPTSSLT